MMQQGTNIALKALGQQFLEGTILEATKQAGKTFTLKGLTQGLFVGLAVNSAVGYAKYYFNTRWNEEEVEIMVLNNQFQFQNVKIIEADYFNDHQNLMEILEEVNTQK
ncbi:hypothetical protein ABPG72_021262 [Tetrahymena utriculariae]